MAVTEAFNNTNGTWGTEYSLTGGSTTIQTQTGDGVYQVWVDLVNLARGDQYQLRAYEKVQSAGTQRRVASWDIFGAQTEPIIVAPALMLMHGWDFTLKRIAGTDRTITSSVKALGGTPTEYANGSASMTTTEYFLASGSTTKTKQTSAGVYQLFLDNNAVAKSDIFEIKCTEEARDANTNAQVCWQHEVVGLQTNPHFASPALALLNGWEWSIDKIAGTDRTIAYSIRKLA